ncbi:unnamed protein product [Paramecium octaurelia]|uniref:Uncharacterized protein n=1 Tax=Paramecium octaurelia TaxID=43137 RepID=A0A8S1U5J5_PAROT|nr:unnamed protein product [Paramecium octaurelia]
MSNNMYAFNNNKSIQHNQYLITHYIQDQELKVLVLICITYCSTMKNPHLCCYLNQIIQQVVHEQLN